MKHFDKHNSKRKVLQMIFLMFCPILAAQTYNLTLNVDTAGTLNKLIAAEIKDSVVSLTLSGELNGSDILFIREMAGSDKNGKATKGNLAVLDISKATFVAGGSFYYLYYSMIENKIGNYMFYKCPKLKSVFLPENIEFMGVYAFSECNSLESVYISNGFVSIGSQAFYKCPSFKSIIVDSRNENLASEDGVLFDKGFTSLIMYPCQKQDSSYTIPSSVKTVKSEAFYDCGALKSVIMPDNVTNLGTSSFYRCVNLQNVSFSKNLTSIPEKAFSKCSSLVSVDLPYSLITIEKEAFSECTKLSSVIMQQQVTSIGERAFIFCKNLISVAFPGSLKTIGRCAFFSCDSLETAILPSDLEELGVSAFVSCGITLLVIPGSINTIRGATFSGCSKLTELVIPEGITRIEEGAFANCSGLDTIVLPQSLKDIGPEAFRGCNNLNNLFIPKDVLSIDERAFMSCKNLCSFTVDNLNPKYCSREGVLFNKDASVIICHPNKKSLSYVIPNSVNHIGNYAFYQSDISNIQFTDYVETIGRRAFHYCNNLTSLDLPCVTSLEVEAFSQCKSIKSITMPYLEEIKESAFGSCISLDSIEIPENVSCINGGAFASCTSLKSVTLCKKLDSINLSAFHNCISLRKIYCKNPIPAVVQPYNYDFYNAFYRVNMDSCLLIVPKGSFSRYSNAYGWYNFKQIIEEGAVVSTPVAKTKDPIIAISNGVINISDMPDNSNAEIFTLSGNLIDTIRAGENNSSMVMNKGFYIVRISASGKVYKISI